MNKQALFRIYWTVIRIFETNSLKIKKKDGPARKPARRPSAEHPTAIKKIVVLSGRQLALIEELLSTC